ncbi:CDT1-like protein a, chloroplastic [Dichanthelium oligosanthes]|uniref:CDT1-like protein a, chloroplastic n=1 Tax=Dichanthelium oligosanthes TaxID=888268 RepID=A0A1E5VFQ5_9POAL|nr:CDT1-like protein a, chloroplastic [Dichanthelium oligosanthes]
MEMDAAPPPKKAKTTAAAAAKLRKDAALAAQVLTPEKPAKKMVAAAAAAEHILTPEKPEERPRGARGRSVALSVKEVRLAALGLRRPAAQAEAVVEGELESVERELGVGAGDGGSPVKREAEVKLPESYEMLCEFFNCLESSTRLLRLKGSKATFPNICASIQHLSERRFTYSHLAQLKYIMPEAIVIDKILLRDNTTCCMKPDLQVNLLVGAVENVRKQKGETAYLALRRIFRERLVDFFRDHPEGDDIPEHELPHPFNRTRSSMPPDVLWTVPESVSPLEPSDLNGQQTAVMSHMSQSFKRRFSQRSPISSTTPSTSSPLMKVASTVPSPLSRNSLFSSNVSGSMCVDDKSSAKEVQVSGVLEGTPAKYASTPVRLMASTPDLKTPKRPISATGCDTPPLKMAKRSARAKLFTTPTKGGSSMDGENQSASMSAADGDDELLSFLPRSLLQSVKEKEERALEEKETGFADQVKRQKLIASLPSTFDIIFLIYQSRQRSVMTKQELIHKIIASSPKIVDRSEVEQHLTLLEELVPDWISEKTARSGDALCCVDATLSQAEIRQRVYASE